MQINGYDWGTYYKSTGKYVLQYPSLQDQGVSLMGMIMILKLRNKFHGE